MPRWARRVIAPPCSRRLWARFSLALTAQVSSHFAHPTLVDSRKQRRVLSVVRSIVVCMLDTDLSGLDADATLAFAGRSRAEADRLEAGVLVAAAHWADLHGHLVDEDRSGVSLPGMEQLVRLGGDGTTEVAEFAPAELGAELATSPFAARQLIADALDLRHRLPRLWGRVLAGEVKPWIGRKTAEATRSVCVETAATVDQRVTRWAHSLSWELVKFSV